MNRIRHFGYVAFACAAVGLMGASPPHGTAPSQTLTINYVSCYSNGASSTGDGTGSCFASVSGGTGIYTYSWEPEPVSSSGSRARIPCILESPRNVWLTVTDSNGATAFFATSFFCGRAD
jgi:hypothetical protein